MEGKKKKKSEPKPITNERASKEDIKGNTVEKESKEPKEPASATVPQVPIGRRETLEETEEERKTYAKEQLEQEKHEEADSAWETQLQAIEESIKSATHIK